MKGNSDLQPDRLQKLGSYWQIRWNIVRNDRTDEEGNTRESWDYEYANCKSPERDDLIEGIIRSRYTQDKAEAILANYAQRKDVAEYLKFQAFRQTAKEIADNQAVTTKQKIQVKMPLSFVLSGGKYELLADRVLKVVVPYELTTEAEVEMVTAWLGYIEPEHEVIQEDEEVEVSMVSLLA